MQHFYAQNETTITDSNFEQYLETHDKDGAVVAIGSTMSMGDGIINNNLVFKDKIAFVVSLNISGLNITELTGLKDFSILETLICSDNQLTAIDISSNLELVSLSVSNNQLQGLNVATNTKLKFVSCASNRLNSLNVSTNVLLESLDISRNLIPNDGLLGLNSCIEISSLNISSNNFDALNFSNLTKLISFNCSSNQFTQLDLSSYPDLQILNCTANKLRTLNIKNGFNSDLILMNALYNPNLYCIQADDTFMPNGAAVGWQKDDLTFYSSTTCENLTYVPDDNFEQALIDLGYDSNLDDFVLTASIEALTTLDVSLKNISDLTGIADFTALQNLDCSDNPLASLDLSMNVALTTITLTKSLLSELDLSNNTALTTLTCNNNSLLVSLILGGNNVLSTLTCNNNTLLSSLDLSQNTAIISIECTNNKDLTNIKLGSNIVLTSLNCFDNALSSLNLGSTVALTTLNCSNNALTSLNLGTNTSLTSLNCSNNILESLNLGSNTTLTTVECSNNSLINLNASKNSGLEALICSNNSLTSLNLGSNTVLTTLDCASNSLIELDLPRNTALTTVNCSSNSLVNLNLDSNTTLTAINCSSNALTSLDLSSNTLLTTLNCAANSLLKLNLKNGNNTIVSSFDTRTNPSLSCVEVDDAAASTTNWTNIDATTSFSTNCNTTLIPDSNFENYLETHDKDGTVVALGDLTSMGDGIANNNFVSTDNISVVITLNISGLSITDLTGVADFTALSNLDCSTNSLISLDLSSNTALATLDCSTNSLVILDVSTNNAIIAFDATTNPNLSCIKIDLGADKTAWLKDPTASYSEYCNTTYVPDNAFEAYLEVNGMGDGINSNNFVLTDKISVVTTLDISNLGIADLTGIEDFSSLLDLNCSDNALIQLELNSNTALTILNCSSNSLMQLDLNSNTALTLLNSSANQINSLNLSGNIALTTIDCSDNLITALDFSGNLSLSTLDCNNNLLTSLNIRNGANGDLTAFNSTLNPTLFCIEADDTFAPAGAAFVWEKDDFASYSDVDCTTRQTNVPDDAFEAYLEANALGDGVANNNLVSTSNIEYITTIDLSGLAITDLTGIEDFISLQELNCSNNYLTNLNVQANTALTILNSGGNNLVTLDVTKNIALVELLCDSNNLIALDISQNTGLERLNCNSNDLTSLDVTANVDLQKLVCAGNELTALIGISGKLMLTDLNFSNNYVSAIDLTGNVALQELKGSKNNLTVLNTADNINLETLDINSNTLSNLDLNSNTILHKLNGSLNLLESLSLTANAALDTLNISGNNFSTINLTTNTELISLDISKNTLTSLPLTTNTKLEDLNVSNNVLETLLLNNNPLINDLNIASNQFSEIDIVALSSLLKFNCSSNNFTTLDLNSNSTITSLNCSNNELFTLSLKNWSNNDLKTFNALGNPNLTCIEINNVGSIGASWSKDAGASYSINCRYNATYVPDNAFEQSLITLGYDTVLDNYVATADVNTLKSLNLSGLGISDLTGIEDFAALEVLDCSGSLFTSLNLSENSALTTLTINDNSELTNLNLVNNTALTTLTCNNNALLTSLNLTTNTALTTLECSGNLLSSLDIATNTDLSTLDCSSNLLSSLDLASNTVLVILDCSNNTINSLDLTTNASLMGLNCAANALTSLDLASNINLTTIDCSSNQIEHIDASLNINLTSLVCTNNLLTTLNTKNGNNANLATFDASLNPTLSCIEVDAAFASAGGLGWQKDTLATYAENCRYNDTDILDANFEAYLETHDKNGNIVALGDLTSMGDGIAANTIVFKDRIRDVTALNISALGIADLTGIADFINLANLNCSNNVLANLDLSANTTLTTLNCAVNQIDNLNLSSNSALTSLVCNENSLTLLNIQNGQNGILNLLNATANPYLYCIQVDVGFAPAGAVSGWQKEAFASYSAECAYFETYVPDDNFETYLESIGLGDGIANNDLVLTSMVNTFVLLDISDLGIADLTGIEDFIRLEELDCSGNLLTDLVLERNKNLSNLNCSNNSALANINLDQNINLTTFNSSGNSLNAVNLTSNTKLVTLDISNNAIATLSLFDNHLLENLNISSNVLTSLNLTSHTALSTFICNNNDFSNLDLSNNTALDVLNIASNQFTSIDLTKLTKLTSLDGSSNMITDLDLSLNTLLTDVNFDSNALNTLNLKNGNNASIIAFTALNNPTLSCIEVDDPTLANGAGWLKDASCEFLIDCHYGQFYVPDDAFEQALIYLGYDSGPLDDYVPDGNVQFVTSLSLNNNAITDLTGIAEFTSLVSLDCRNNNLVTLDLSNNLALEILKCSENQLVNLDVSANSQLITLNSSNNVLGSLDISANANLNELNCSNNQLVNLVLNSTLEILDCSYNQLTSLGLSSNTNLTALNSSSNQLIDLDLKSGNNASLLNLDIQNNPDLICVLVDDIAAARSNETWLKDISALYKIVCLDDDDDGIANENDSCPNTPFGTAVDLFGCPYFSLPYNNFTVLIAGETCLNSNNGKVNVTAVETKNYTATITSDDYTNTYKFTNELEIRNLLTGNFVLCITVEESPEYMSCYDIVISEPEKLVVLTNKSTKSKKVTLDLSGSTSYIIELNGLKFNTTDSSIDLVLNNRQNTIKVSTDLECQGIYEEHIFISEGIFVYPNPVEDKINIYLGDSDAEKTEINIFSPLGQLVYSKSYVEHLDFVTIDANNLPLGLYLLIVKTDETLSTFKVLKK